MKKSPPTKALIRIKPGRKPRAELGAIDKAIRLLIQNKNTIQGLVLSVGALPGKKIDGEGDGAVLSIDISCEPHNENVRSIFTQGLVNQAAQHVLPSQRGFFGL